MVVVFMLLLFRKTCRFVCGTPPMLETSVVSVNVADASAGADMSIHVVIIDRTVDRNRVVCNKHVHCSAIAWKPVAS